MSDYTIVDDRTKRLDLTLPHEGNELQDDVPRLRESFKKIDAYAVEADAATAALDARQQADAKALAKKLEIETTARAKADAALNEALQAETAARKAPATTNTLGSGFVATAAEVSSGVKEASRGDAPAFVDVAHVNAIRDKHIYINGAWRSQDGLAWYRKWSDGFIEQGGFVGHNTSNYTWVNLYTPFTSINYTVIATLGLMSGPYPAVSGLTAFSDSHATTGFSLFTRTQDNQLLTFSTFWRASGF